MDGRNSGREFWDLNTHHHFPGAVADEAVVAAFAEKYESFNVNFDPIETLLRLSESTGWSPQDMSGLAALSVDQFYQIFKDHSGKDLSKMVRAALKLEQYGGPTEEMLEISRLAKEALARIGAESRINSLRVRKLGIDVGDGAAFGARVAGDDEGVIDDSDTEQEV
jgi:hypothetical protein